MTMFDNDYYFEQLREFVPRDALAILNQTKEKIATAIGKEVEQFAKELATAVNAELEKQRREAAEALVASQQRIAAALEALEAATIDEGKIAALRTTIDDHEKRWRSLGEQLGNVVKKAIKTSTGIDLA
jgi:hypothetical protein